MTRNECFLTRIEQKRRGFERFLTAIFGLLQSRENTKYEIRNRMKVKRRASAG
jgi:hypothetical protein